MIELIRGLFVRLIRSSSPDHDAVLPLAGRFSDAVDQVGNKRVPRFGDQKPDDVGAPAHAPRCRIRAVAEFLDLRLGSLPQPFADTIGIPQDL